MNIHSRPTSWPTCGDFPFHIHVFAHADYTRVYGTYILTPIPNGYTLEKFSWREILSVVCHFSGRKTSVYNFLVLPGLEPGSFGFVD